MKQKFYARKELICIAIGVTVLCGVMSGVYLLLHRWTLAVGLGTLLGGGYAVFNFYLQARSVQKALASGDQAGKVIRSGYSMRMLGIVAMLVLAAAVKQIDVLAACIPLLFPRITISAMQLFGLYRPEEFNEEEESNHHG